MTEETTGFGPVEDINKVNPVSGERTDAEQFKVEEAYKVEREGELTLIDEGLSTATTLYQTATSVAIDMSLPPDPLFDAKKHPELYEGVPAQFHRKIATADNEVEALAIRGQAEDYLHNVEKLQMSGMAGTSATVVGAMIDADAVLIPLSGGTYLGTKTAAALTKAGLKAGRLKGVMTGAAAGIEAGALTSVGEVAFNNVGDAQNVPYMLLGGFGMGAFVGGVTKLDYKLMDAADAARAEIVNNRLGETKRIPGPGTAGAQQAVNVPAYFDQLRTSTKDILRNSVSDINAMNYKKVREGELNAATTNTDSEAGLFFENVQRWVDKTPLRGMHTELGVLGDIGNKLSYDLFPHPGGMSDNVRPAEAYMRPYLDALSAPSLAYHDYALAHIGKSNDRYVDKMRNIFEGGKSFAPFNREFLLEMENRLHDGKPGANTSQHVLDFADEVDSASARAVGIQQGLAGETPVRGSETLKPTAGYFSRRWNGAAMMEHGNRAEIEMALQKGYRAILGQFDVDPTVVDKISKAIVARAMALEEGIDTNLVGLLRAEGKEFLRDILKVNDVSAEDADRLITKLTGSAQDKAKPGFLKERIELDLRVPVGTSGKQLIDFVDQDVYANWQKYSRRVAGHSALARYGYQPGQITDYVEAIIDEMRVAGKPVDPKRVDDVVRTAFSYFTGGPIGEGLGPLIRSALSLTRQSLLGSLGITQVSEMGNIIAATGWESVKSVLPGELQAAVTGKGTALTQELHNAFMMVGKDHILFDDRLALDVAAKNPWVQGQYAEGIKNATAFGDKILGHTSLFYKSLAFTQNVAVASINHHIYDLLGKGSLDANATRKLLDAGFDDDIVQMLQDKIANGVITKGEDGMKLNLDKWGDKELQAYKIAMYTFADRLIQKAHAGETPYLMTKPMGQVLTQLRSFGLLSVQKQFLRQARMADPAIFGSVAWNLAVAGMVYSTSEIVKGRGEKLDAEKVIKGAVNYSPVIGWAPMFTDPVTAILGLDELRFNQYGRPGTASEGIIPIPPSITQMNKMLHIPGAAISAMDGSVNYNEATALSATPIIGSMIGFSAYFTHLKQYGDSTKEPKPKKQGSPRIGMDQKTIDQMQADLKNRKPVDQRDGPGLPSIGLDQKELDKKLLIMEELESGKPAKTSEEKALKAEMDALDKSLGK